MAEDTNLQPPNAETPPADTVYFPGVETPPKQPSQIIDIPTTGQPYTFGASVVPLEQLVPEPTKKAPANPIYLFGLIAVGLGLLVGIAIAANLLRTGLQGQPSDLPPVVSSADGLRGRLVTKWDGKPEYRFSVEPNDPQQTAGFAFAVAHSPRPVAFDIQLKDPLGFVLCGRNIVLKYDPRQSANPGATDPASQAAQAIDIAKLEALELEREFSGDIFQSDLGPDGQVASISAQGNLACSKSAYENAASWSFSSNFPTLDEQAALLKPPAEAEAAATGSSSERSTIRKSRKWKPTEIPTPFYIEGDDSIVAYDASTGIIETGAGRSSFIDKTGATANEIKGRDFPIAIHYRCDQTGNCIIAGAGPAALHVRLRR